MLFIIYNLSRFGTRSLRSAVESKAVHFYVQPFFISIDIVSELIFRKKSLKFWKYYQLIVF